MTIEMSAVTPMLKTKNLEETIALYTGTLGFSLENQRNDGPEGKVSWCSLRCGGASVMFYSMDSLDAPAGPPAMTGVLYFNPKRPTERRRRFKNQSFRLVQRLQGQTNA